MPGHAFRNIADSHFRKKKKSEGVEFCVEFFIFSLLGGIRVK